MALKKKFIYWAPNLLFGALLFAQLANAATAPGETLAVELFQEASWIACISECDRTLACNPDNDAITLLRLLALTRNGADSSAALNTFCNLKSVDTEIKALANYELGRLLWGNNQTADAFQRFKIAFDTTQNRDLFIRSACSLNIITTKEPAITGATSSLSNQLQTCSSLWDLKIQKECLPSKGETQIAVSGAPGRWMIQFYRSQISPAIGQRCALTPSCSEYARQALSQYGILGLSMYGDRAVREPDVVAAHLSPVKINGHRKFEDSLEDHTRWFNPNPARPVPPVGLLATSILTAQLTNQSNSTLKDSITHTLSLARQLSEEGQHRSSALEFRRAAEIGITENQEDSATCYWLASHEYLLDGDYKRAMKMLDKAEAIPAELTSENLILRAEAELANNNLEESHYYLQSLINGNNMNYARLASLKLAQIMILQNNPDEALKAVAASETPSSTSITTAIEAFRSGNDKSPTLAGILGIIPGGGYAYSGEYANALRSLILNSIFIFGMVKTAEDNNWGAFSAITFFELTWFSGSIYGGIDSADRYNRNRVSACINVITHNVSFTPELEKLPALSIKITF